MVLLVGVDVHKDTHTAVVADEVGRQRGQRTCRATDAVHRALVRWVRREHPVARVWAVEDCRPSPILTAMGATPARDQQRTWLTSEVRAKAPSQRVRVA